MTITVHQVEDKNIIHFVVEDPMVDVIGELKTAYADAAQIISEITGDYVRIFDASPAQKITFSQIVQGMREALDHQQGSVADTRAKTIYVGELMKMVADSYNQDQYGNLTTQWVATPQEALEIALEMVG